MRLHEYLQRIGVDGPLPPTAETLRRLHGAHRQTFLFENLSIQTGGQISVELPDIEQKFLDRRQGGYCFEHNTLFGAVLGQIGFGVASLLGRVRRGPPERWARTHMVLRVVVPATGNAAAGPAAAPHETYLADVGFGALSLIEPMPLRDGESVRQLGITYTLRREEFVWVLSMEDASQSMDLYEFAEEPQTQGDILIANHFTSTHPESIFRKTLTIQSVRGGRRVLMRNGIVSRWQDGRLIEEAIDRAQLPQTARDLFGIDLPDGPFVFER